MRIIHIDYYNSIQITFGTQYMERHREAIQNQRGGLLADLVPIRSVNISSAHLRNYGLLVFIIMQVVIVQLQMSYILIISLIFKNWGPRNINTFDNYVFLLIQKFLIRPWLRIFDILLKNGVQVKVILMNLIW